MDEEHDMTAEHDQNLEGNTDEDSLYTRFVSRGRKNKIGSISQKCQAMVFKSVPKRVAQRQISIDVYSGLFEHYPLYWNFSGGYEVQQSSFLCMQQTSL